MFRAHQEVTFEYAAVGELFFAESVLQVVFPEALVALTVRVDINSESVRLVAVEPTGVNVTISVTINALALRHAVSPVAVVAGPIGP